MLLFTETREEYDAHSHR